LAKEAARVTVGMDRGAAPSTAGPGPLDHLGRELRALRRGVGEPSYAEIARRVAELRMGHGLDEHAARVAKSTVHDAFRPGRSRINLALVREIVEALGADPSLTDQWLAGSEEPEPEPEPAQVSPPATLQVALLVTGCVVLNLLGREFVDFFRLPIYLDMVGTAIAALSLGPWRGAAVGLATNVIGVVGSGWVSLPFGAVNVVGALVLGYGVHRWRLGRTLPRFFLLTVLAAVACSAVAVPIIALLLGHTERVGHDAITAVLDDSIDAYWVTLPFANLLTSLADKLISGFAALVAVATLPTGFRSGLLDGPTLAPGRELAGP
jgi:energy-coupling factor transport system substrate-specific component